MPGTATVQQGTSTTTTTTRPFGIMAGPGLASTTAELVAMAGARTA